MKGRVLIVAGSDSGGGAGIQADIKTVTMFGGFAMTAIAALTVQDTTAVHDVMAIPASFVGHQMEVVLKDIGADAVKIGMLANAEIVAAVADMLEAHAAEVPVVLDPVMVATSGGVLLVNDAVSALKSGLVSRATVVTPNIPETEVLVGHPVRNVADMAAAGREILKLGPRAVLVKGGHLDAPEVI
ncbi:MAG TPA: bifunctional hydroxymethylpyrimidine kinase/phosphomethylpyrimidine kinase, partial [Sphingomonadales bacterium]